MKFLLLIWSFIWALICAPIPALALPFTFERNYINSVWAYQNRGCVIDPHGYVYIYDFVNTGGPMRQVGRMNADAFERAKGLFDKASRAPYKSEQVAVDAGSTVWKGSVGGREYWIRESGDFEGGREVAEAEEFVRAIEAVCPRY